MRAQSLNVLPLKPGVGQYIAIHATLTAREFFLVYFNPSGPFTCIFFQNLSRFLLCWLWLTHGSCVGPQNTTQYNTIKHHFINSLREIASLPAYWQHHTCISLQNFKQYYYIQSNCTCSLISKNINIKHNTVTCCFP